MTALYITIAAVGLVIVTELMARALLLRGRYYVWSPTSCENLEPDPEVHPQLERQVRFQVNSLGERGAPPPGAGTFRILAVGGSAVECYLLDQDSSWPEVMARRLRSVVPGRSGVHIGNIGKSGVDSRTLDYMLEKVLPNYADLDLILIMVGASDVLRWLERGAPSGGVCEPMNVSQCFYRHPEKRFSWNPKCTAYAELIRYLLARRTTTRPRAAKWYGKARAMRAAAERVREEYGDDAEVMRQFEKYFRSCLERSSLAAKKVLVVRQPWFEKQQYLPDEERLFWNGGIGKAYKEEIKEYFSSRVICRLMGEIDRRATSLCAELQIPQLDLMPVLERSTATYFDHFHFTPAGSERVADAVAEAVISLEGWGS